MIHIFLGIVLAATTPPGDERATLAAVSIEDRQVFSAAARSIRSADAAINTLFVENRSATLHPQFAQTPFDHLHSYEEAAVRARREFKALMLANRSERAISGLTARGTRVISGKDREVSCRAEPTSPPSYSPVARFSRPGYSQDHSTALVFVRLTGCLSETELVLHLSYSRKRGWRVVQRFTLNEIGE